MTMDAAFADLVIAAAQKSSHDRRIPARSPRDFGASAPTFPANSGWHWQFSDFLR
jgi:hypothetical protein